MNINESIYRNRLGKTKRENERERIRDIIIIQCRNVYSVLCSVVKKKVRANGQRRDKLIYICNIL